MFRTVIRLAVLVPLLACASMDEPFMVNASDIDREVAIKEEFQRAATEALHESNAVLDREAADELRLLWQMAARRLVEDDAPRSHVARAVSDVHRIVMAAAGRSLPTGGVTREITMDGYERAKLTLCPLYPFC